MNDVNGVNARERVNGKGIVNGEGIVNATCRARNSFLVPFILFMTVCIRGANVHVHASISVHGVHAPSTRS
jgi:hypothetical protein